MDTHQLWNIDYIKAVATLWPLALVCFLTLLLCFLALLLFVAIYFFRPQTRRLLNGLKNFKFKLWEIEISVNHTPSASVSQTFCVDASSNKVFTSGKIC